MYYNWEQKKSFMYFEKISLVPPVIAGAVIIFCLFYGIGIIISRYWAPPTRWRKKFFLSTYIVPQSDDPKGIRIHYTGEDTVLSIHLVLSNTYDDKITLPGSAIKFAPKNIKMGNESGNTFFIPLQEILLEHENVKILAIKLLFKKGIFEVVVYDNPFFISTKHVPNITLVPDKEIIIDMSQSEHNLIESRTGEKWYPFSITTDTKSYTSYGIFKNSIFKIPINPEKGEVYYIKPLWITGICWSPSGKTLNLAGIDE
jgi:hypothetical protein